MDGGDSDASRNGKGDETAGTDEEEDEGASGETKSEVEDEGAAEGAESSDTSLVSGTGAGSSRGIADTAAAGSCLGVKNDSSLACDRAATDAGGGDASAGPVDAVSEVAGTNEDGEDEAGYPAAAVADKETGIEESRTGVDVPWRCDSKATIAFATDAASDTMAGGTAAP